MKIKAILIMTLPLLAIAIPKGQTTAAAVPDPTDSADSWRVVLDGVMGGRSSGRVSTSVSGNLLFSGDLSLENNGGFSQIRTATPEAAYRDAEGIQIRVHGDGRAYNFDLRVSNARMMAGAFQQEFQTLDGQWLTLQLPFDEFRLYSFGRRVRNAIALSPSLIESVGVTLSDKNEGSFRLEISEITPYGENVLRAPSSNPGIETEAIRLIELSINRGAPLFNAGQTAACASVYELTIESLLALGAGRLDRATIQRLEMGLAEAETMHSASDRAWVCRRTMDEVYARLNRAAVSSRSAVAH